MHKLSNPHSNVFFEINTISDTNLRGADGAGKMSKGRVAVVLVNAFQHQQSGKPGWVAGPANVTARWADLWLQNEKVMQVRDAINHRDLGTASGAVTVVVNVHDVAVLVLSPVNHGQ